MPLVVFRMYWSTSRLDKMKLISGIGFLWGNPYSSFAKIVTEFKRHFGGLEYSGTCH